MSLATCINADKIGFKKLDLSHKKANCVVIFWMARLHMLCWGVAISKVSGAPVFHIKAGASC